MRNVGLKPIKLFNGTRKAPGYRPGATIIINGCVAASGIDRLTGIQILELPPVINCARLALVLSPEQVHDTDKQNNNAQRQ